MKTHNRLSAERFSPTPGIEALETRIAPAVFLVNSIADSVATDGNLTLREAINAANTNAPSGDAVAGDSAGDIILFDSSLSALTISLSLGEFTISDDLQIFGRSSVGGASIGLEINANLNHRLFNIGTSENVAFLDLHLSEGFAPAGNSGGAIFINSGGNLSLTGVEISDSDAVVSGGAIFNNGGTLSIANSNMHGNTAAGAAVTDGGGAIFNNAGTVTLQNVDLLVNRAPIGSANGGGIMSVGGSVEITDGFITGNLAARAGGGIEVNAGALTMTNVTLGNTLDGNSAGINGGGLHISGAATVSITGGKVEDNIANQEGGGLWNSSSGTLIVTSVNIHDNTANGNLTEQGGGGVFNDGGTMRIVTSTITDNISTATAVGNGGGGVFNRGTMTIVASTISGNTANNGTANGGGILNSIGASLTVRGGAISENETARAGGGIENNAGTVVLTNVDLEDNFAGINGGGLHTTGPGLVTIIGGSVSENLADQEGGGLWNSSTGTLIIRSSAIGETVIEANLANGDATEQGGGGIFNDGGTVSIADAFITNNFSTATAVGNGGGGIFNDGTMTLNNVEISSNYAADGSANGGGILNSGGATLTIIDSDIVSNNTARAGGGIENNGGAVNITNVFFADNFAGINGGGIHTSGAGTVQIEDSFFSFNVAGNEGGALWNSSAGTMSVENSSIEDNDALFGGGIFNDGSAGTLTVASSTISGNVAGSFGGGLASEGGTVVITNSTISANHSASTRGGGIMVLNGTLTLNGSTVAFNTAVGDAGGGLVIADGVVNVNSSIISDNTRDGIASDIARDAGTLNATNSLFFAPGSSVNGTNTANLTGVDPLLAPLGDNGGDTFTHALLPGSPAINAGLPTAGVDFDQRGEGFPRTAGLGADIGAFEVQKGIPSNSIYAVGAGKGDDVIVFDSQTGNVLFNIDAFDNSRSLARGVTVATGDVNGDGMEDIIVGGGPGREGAFVRVFDGNSGSPLSGFFAYDPGFKGGVFVAAGDINGDGVAEIVTGSGPGRINEPNVKVFDRFGVEFGSITPFSEGFKGGVRVAAGDVTGDGFADIIATPGKGAGSPTVKVFDGTTGHLIQSFLAFPAARSQGVFVAAGDVNGDGIAEIITGLDAGRFGNEVRIYSGFGFGVPRLQINQFPAFSSTFANNASGVRVGVADVNADGIADIILGSGKGRTAQISIVDPLTGQAIRGLSDLPPDFRSGVFVG